MKIDDREDDQSLKLNNLYRLVSANQGQGSCFPLNTPGILFWFFKDACRHLHSRFFWVVTQRCSPLRGWAGPVGWAGSVFQDLGTFIKRNKTKFRNYVTTEPALLAGIPAIKSGSKFFQEITFTGPARPTEPLRAKLELAPVSRGSYNVGLKVISANPASRLGGWLASCN